MVTTITNRQNSALGACSLQALALLVQVALRALTAPLLMFDLDNECQPALCGTVSLCVT